jgi:hypothetical protein
VLLRDVHLTSSADTDAAMKDLIQGFLGGVGFILASQALHYAPVLIRLGGTVLIFALFALLVLRLHRRWQERQLNRLQSPPKVINPR